MWCINDPISASSIKFLIIICPEDFNRPTVLFWMIATNDIDSDNERDRL